jgi:branched-chain amino acid transport system substrate-binding protein
MLSMHRRDVLIGGGAAVLVTGFPARAQTKTIKVGAFGPETGPNAVTSVSLQGTAAYFKAMNDAGGIGGYTFDYVVIDDQYNPALTVNAARRLVEQEKVLALVNPIGTGPVLAVKDYLESKKVPSVGLTTAPSTAGPYHYLVGQDFVNEGAFQAQFAAKNLIKSGKLGIIYLNSDIGKSYLKGVEYFVSQSQGLELTQVPYQPNTLDFTPAVALLHSGGAETVIFSGSPNYFAPIIKAAEQLFYRPSWIGVSYHGSPDVLRQLPSEQTAGMHFVTYTAVPGTTDVADLEAALKKYYPETDVTSLTAQGWTGGTIFGEGFKRMVESGKEPSREALTEALNTFSAFSNSMIRNITYTEGPGIKSSHLPRPYEAVMEWKNDRLSIVVPFGEVAKVPGQPGQ